MSIGYACLTVGVPNTNIKGLTLKNMNDERLSTVISHNLTSLENILKYNLDNKIEMFRISSDIIPFGSLSTNKYDWKTAHEEKFERIAHLIKNHSMRISMHPGQYTVLNSPNPKVVQNSIEDLKYHTDFLEKIETPIDAKIILHIGGIYDDKQNAIQRFKDVYRDLDHRIKRRLVIENDDKLYNVMDVLQISSSLGIPVVYDTLHNFANPSPENKSHLFWIKECAKTWETMDGRQEIHYSQQDIDKKPGAHSPSIKMVEFLDFFHSLEGLNPNIMLEVKDKNVSAIKCINLLDTKGKIKSLEKEWGKYKYAVLERSAPLYNKIRSLLKDKSDYPVIEFYNLIEEAMEKDPDKGSIINAAQHVWGHFDGEFTPKEQESFNQYLQEKELDKTKIKKLLHKIALRCSDAYLVNSLYFY